MKYTLSLKNNNFSKKKDYVFNVKIGETSGNITEESIEKDLKTAKYLLEKKKKELENAQNAVSENMERLYWIREANKDINPNNKKQTYGIR